MFTKKVITGLNAFSNIILGCDHMDENISKATSLRNMELYCRAGGTVFDTARSYSQEGNLSRSETLVGQFVRSNGLRKDLVIVTKGGRENGDPSTFLDVIKEDYCRSVDQLGFEPDIWFLHRDCLPLGVEEIIGGALSFLGSGVRLGLSNWGSLRFREALKLPDKPVVSEIQFSLAATTPAKLKDLTLRCMDPEEKAFYEETAIPVFAYSSQGKGIFSKLISGAPLSPKCIERFDGPEVRAKAVRVEELSRRHGVSTSAVVTSYIYSQKKFAAFPIISCSTASQMEDCLSGSDVRLDQAEIDYLEKGGTL